MRILGLVWIVAASVTGALAQAKPSAPGLVGTWRLVSFEDRPSQGDAQLPFGAKPKGLLIYDATGHMAIQIMKVPHPKVGTKDEQQLKPEEKVALFDAYVAYFGTYSVDAKKRVVTHHVEGDFGEVYVGRAEERPYELTGDRLTLKPEWDAFGKHWKGTRVFERVKR